MDNEKNFVEEFFKDYQSEMNAMGHVNLIIAGKTGVGKSTLLNAAFRENVADVGSAKPITNDSSMKWYEKDGYPLRLYDTVGLELDDKTRDSTIEKILTECNNAKKNNDPDKFIHAMWYCVLSESDRLEPYEADFINKIAEQIPVILVLTKSFRKKHAEKLRNAIKTEYPELDIKNDVVLLAADEDEEDCDEGKEPEKSFGVDILVEMTAQIVPESAQKAWCNAQKASMKLKEERSQKLIIATAATSFGEGYIPLPFSAAYALVPTQLGMLAGITAIFGISVSKNLLLTIVTSMAGCAGTTFTGRTIVSNLLKMIPGVGTVLGGTINGATASALTVALGESYVQIMKMVMNGEIKEQDLGSKAVQDKLCSIYKKNVSKKIRKNKK